MSPFYGPVFKHPWLPWMTHHVGERTLQHPPGVAWPLLELRAEATRNSAAACWVRTRTLSKCIDVSRKVIRFASYLAADSVIDATPELALTLRRSLRLPPAAPLPTRELYDAASLHALLPALSSNMAAHLDAVRAKLGWGRYKLRIGVHMRVFVVRRWGAGAAA